MVNVNDAFPSNYLKASDLKGREVTVAIRNVLMEDVGSDHKPVLYFMDKEKGLVLNKTNSMNIASAYGPETDGWSGKLVVLYTSWVDFQGRSVEAIRVRPAPASQAQQPRAVPSHPNAPGGELDDAIGF